jgi:hypothetical protein
VPVVAVPVVAVPVVAVPVVAPLGVAVPGLAVPVVDVPEPAAPAAEVSEVDTADAGASGVTAGPPGAVLSAIGCPDEMSAGAPVGCPAIFALDADETADPPAWAAAAWGASACVAA